MNEEMKILIELVRNSVRPVQEIVDQYFEQVVFSNLKQEWMTMSKKQKTLVVKKLATERKVKKPVRPKETVQVVSKSKSKMDLATQYLEDNSGLRRKEALAYFKESIGLTPAGAATYWNLIRKKLNYQTAKK